MTDAGQGDCLRRLHPAALVLLAALFAADAQAAMQKVAIASLDGRLSLHGYWFAVEANQPQPAVIVLHGCSGMLNRDGTPVAGAARDASHFNAERMHLLALDSFTPRGLRSICEIKSSQRTVREEDRREDVYAAIGWLAAQPGVDASRIAVMGRSHGAQTVLSVIDGGDAFVRAQAVRPAAAIALYPGCARLLAMKAYAPVVPLSLMSGALDDWTPAENCRRLHERMLRERPQVRFDFTVYADSWHGFDGVGPVVVRGNLNTSSGSAHVGGNPQAREASHARTFEFLAGLWQRPLLLSHGERLLGHRYVVPPASGFADIADMAAVPVSTNGRSRYEHYLKALRSPKAFAVTEKGGWYFASDDVDAMHGALASCDRAKVRCWLYAVDERVVWQREPGTRIGVDALRRKAP